MTVKGEGRSQQVSLRLAAAVLVGQVLAYLVAGSSGLFAASVFFGCYLVIRFIIARRT